MELSRLRRGEEIAGAGGVALLVVMFLDWYGAGGTARFQGQDFKLSIGLNAWQVFSVTDLILALTAASAIALAVLTASRRSPALPVAASVITATLGAFATLLVFYRILNQPGPNQFFDVKLGAFLGFVSVLAIAVGGYLAMRDEDWEGAPMATDVRPTPARTAPAAPQDPPAPEPRA